MSEKEHRCGICGIALKEGQWIYSPTTQQRYCLPDKWVECSDRSVAEKETVA